MAKKVQLTYKEIEDRLSKLKDAPVAAEEIGYKLLYSFGKPEREIERYKEGKDVISTFDGLLIKGLLCYKASSTLKFASALDELKQNPIVLKAAPKIIAVSDGTTIRAYDLRHQQTFEQQVNRLYCDFEFFYPLAGVERIEYVEESPADIKAAEKLAKLHDEIRAYNEFTSDSDLHDLNTFIARLLFCFFAEDTGIFAEGVFTNAIKTFTHDARNLKDVLEQIFRYMGKKPIPAGVLQTYCMQHFAFVGGGLFERSIYIPELSNKARQIIIDSGELDWQNINPDIFGSMIQAVVNPSERATQGMHYTSVPNIRKVINPLFLDDLKAQYQAIADDVDKLKEQKDIGQITQQKYYEDCKSRDKKCDHLLKRISRMKFFDPACGSGNFLIITYKQLRLLEMKILALKKQCTGQGLLEFIDGSCIRLNQFYGIELLDFPHEIAMLSLWLAEHQMNKKMREDFGVNTQALPLKDICNIRCGNACRIDWNEVCPHTAEEEVFVFGNPPYKGARLQEKEQKEDMEFVFQGIKGYNNLDYIAAWIFKGSNYILENTQVAFVSTNSICQGEQVALLWPHIFERTYIRFAYSSCKWSNNAKHVAGVSFVIIGLCHNNKKTVRTIYTEDSKTKTETNYINAYLTKGTDTIVRARTKPLLEGIPNIQFGSMANDGGNLLLTKDEKNAIIDENPKAQQFIRKLIGSQEFINGEDRFCLWINEFNVEAAKSIHLVNERIKNCYRVRIKSDRVSTQKLAEIPYKFGEIRQENGPKIIIPRVSSESRKYIPIGVINDKDIVSDSCLSIATEDLSLFGVLHSHLHMVWVETIGGKLETRYRYSASVVYNTFPFPRISNDKRAEIEEAAMDILMTREPYLTRGKTLAELYDPKTMPADLLAAHKKLDDIVESCYQGYPFASDESRLECLFQLYEKMTKKK